MEYVLGAFLYHLWTRPRQSEIFFALGLGVLLRALHHLLLGGPSNSFTSSLMGLGPYLGAASIVVLAVQVLRLAGEEAAAKLRTLEICICLGLVGPVAEQFLGALALLIAPRFDPVLLASDGTLGFQLSFLLGQIFAASRIVSVFETEIYYALTLALAVSFAMHVKNCQAHRRVNLLRAYVICTVVVLGCFAFLPAAGPLFRV
jgi:hypothetical protein